MNGMPDRQTIESAPVHAESSGALEQIGKTLLTLGNSLQKDGNKIQDQTGDARVKRTHLALQELAELTLALANRNEEQIADALGDLLYVIAGTASLYSIPLDAVVKAVHESNMTKDFIQFPRRRGKGPEYRAPNIRLAIEAGRRHL